ncbi:MAG TPA: MFS transporter [Polyangiaceae bacterium]|nr:MFS transporter [Polyangiaceae bacterium]
MGRRAAAAANFKAALAEGRAHLSWYRGAEMNLARQSETGMHAAQGAMARRLPAGVDTSPASAIRVRAPVRHVDVTRRSLTACTTEGALAEVVAACAGANVVTAWAIQLGAGPALLGLMWGLPQVVQLLQLPAAWLTSRFGRRAVAIWAVGASRQVGLALLLLPVLSRPPAAGRAYVLAAFALSAGLGVLGHNAWLTWASDLVPARLRGRYFGRRTALCTFVGTLAAIAAGRLIDASDARGEGVRGLLVLTAIAAVTGAISTAVMRLQHDPPGGPQPVVAWHQLLQPFRDRRARRLLEVQSAWYGAVGLTASLTVFVMLKTLQVGFAGLSIYTATIALMRVVSAPLWGRILDRRGARGILVNTSLGVAALSTVWLWAAPGRIWLVAVDAVASGALLGGQQLALFTLPLAIAPRSSRPVYMAAFVMTAGIAFGVASILGGAVTAPLGASWSIWGRRALFGAAALGRAAAGWLASRIEPNEARERHSDALA